MFLLQIRVLSSNTKKGEIERTFCLSLIFCVLYDNTCDYLTYTMSTSGFTGKSPLGNLYQKGEEKRRKERASLMLSGPVRGGDSGPPMAGDSGLRAGSSCHARRCPLRSSTGISPESPVSPETPAPARPETPASSCVQLRSFAEHVCLLEKTLRSLWDPRRLRPFGGRRLRSPQPGALVFAHRCLVRRLRPRPETPVSQARRLRPRPETPVPQGRRLRC